MITTNIRYRHPHYVRCNDCDAEITGSSTQDVQGQFHSRGWHYDFENDITLCAECYQNREEARQEAADGN